MDRLIQAIIYLCLFLLGLGTVGFFALGLDMDLRFSTLIGCFVFLALLYLKGQIEKTWAFDGIRAQMDEFHAQLGALTENVEALSQEVRDAPPPRAQEDPAPARPSQEEVKDQGRSAPKTFRKRLRDQEALLASASEVLASATPKGDTQKAQRVIASINARRFHVDAESIVALPERTEAFVMLSAFLVGPDSQPFSSDLLRSALPQEEERERLRAASSFIILDRLWLLRGQASLVGRRLFFPLPAIFLDETTLFTSLVRRIERLRGPLSLTALLNGLAYDRIDAAARARLKRLQEIGLNFALDTETRFDFDPAALHAQGFAYVLVEANKVVGSGTMAQTAIHPIDYARYLARSGLSLIACAATSERDVAGLVEAACPYACGPALRARFALSAEGLSGAEPEPTPKRQSA